MSVNDLLCDALKPLGLPVESGIHVTKAKSYYVYSITTYGADFGDDAPSHERCLIQLHLFAPLMGDIKPLVKKTKQALYAAGFTWPEVVDATDEEARHYVFECETAEGTDLDAAV